MRRREYARFYHPVCLLDGDTLPDGVAPRAPNPTSPALEVDPDGDLLLMPTAPMLDEATALITPLMEATFDGAPLSPDEAKELSTALVVAGLLDAFRAQREILRRLALNPSDYHALCAARDYLSNGLAGFSERGTVSLVKLDVRWGENEQVEASRKLRAHAKRTRARALRATRAALRDLNPDGGDTVIPFPNMEAPTDA